MSDRARELTNSFMEELRARYAHETEFLQAVEDVALDVITVEKANPEYARARILARLSEPDRTIAFRVAWADDTGEVRINRGWRVQHCNAVGPYKGGLRFAPTVTQSVLKFLAYEQTFKNALTGLMLGGAKGGSDFDPKGRSDGEVQRFAQAYMAELQHHIGPWRDIPAGDIGVGPREIGYLFAAWKRHTRDFAGVLTGKSQCIGGSAIRQEATGYGAVYFLCAMLARSGEEIGGKRVAISGMGNVAAHAARKALALGARVVCLSDSSGRIEAPDGFSAEALDWVLGAKAAGRSLASPPRDLGLDWHPGCTAWEVEAEIALPCATQYEIGAEAARRLVETGCRWIVEGANMPLTAKAAEIVRDGRIVHAPGKASNAGGVAVSGLEMGQNAVFQPLSAREIDQALGTIMRRIHDTLLDEARNLGPLEGGLVDYRRAANVASYRRVAEALIDHGIV
jgi:glutamate dehydrogenase (NADP+)